MTVARHGIVDAPGRPRISLGAAHRGLATVCCTARDRDQGIAGQVRQVLATLDGLLAEAGSDKSHLLAAQVWLRDMADYEALNAVWNDWVDAENPPVRSCLRADLATPQVLVEIKLTAARKTRRP